MLPKRIKKIFKRRKKPDSINTRSTSSTESRRATPPPILNEYSCASGTTAETSSSQVAADRSETDYSRGSLPERESISLTEVPAVVEEASLEESSSSPKDTSSSATTNGASRMGKHADESSADRRGSGGSYRRGSGGSCKRGSGGSYSLDDEVSPLPNERRLSINSTPSVESDVYKDSASVARSYDSIPLLEQITLPRGGISMDTQAVGRVQFGIPPETIKDSMRLGLAVPNVYIVPVERFCREMGPALGVNLAEFEFPAYFNFFVYKKRCTLIVDNDEAERNIRLVFSETLLGPHKFRREDNPVPYEDEDFDPDFPREAIPNFTKELRHFRIMPDGKELVLETLLNFRHFDMPREAVHEHIGVPPPLGSDSLTSEEPEEEHYGLEHDFSEEPVEEVAVPKDLEGVESREQKNWTYAQTRWLPVSVVYPQDATPEQIEEGNVKRIEIFKMPGGTEYIVHDIDEYNHIVGRARFAGHVKVSASMRVDGFGGIDIVDDVKEEEKEKEDDNDDDDNQKDDDEFESSAELEFAPSKSGLPPTFYPPSFGVTVLGNSHGFDKSGSVSGYVLWINGRGVMIDPPPYSSATLEREGIRPRTIVAIILTHCHADHDAGAFQKVLTGSQVVVITTPTIYQSFIRKYAALSALSPALLRHSHRHKPAIIGTPMRFQGATFHFTYTLHTIPCVGFRVEWRGRSMVFTGDHFNSPPAIDKLQETGVLSKARADDLRNLPLQETDLLLHEAGAPPIHTPLEVLLQLPQRVKRRLYVVHTSALPPDCELRVAPTGTAGTIRLDQMQGSPGGSGPTMRGSRKHSINLEDDSMFSSPWSSASNEYGAIAEGDEEDVDHQYMATSFMHLGVPQTYVSTSRNTRANSILSTAQTAPPLVSLRPASSTDAWFILNLLSAVPFLTSLSYASTMELLETAKVDAFCKDDVVVPAARRNSVLCVVWEGTCVELRSGSVSSFTEGSPPGRHPLETIRESSTGGNLGAVWYAGDWTGPIALQPDKRLSGESDLSETHDVVAMSQSGVKVITVDFSNLHTILKSGSILYNKYLKRRRLQQKVVAEPELAEDESATSVPRLLRTAMRSLNVLELLDSNSALKKFSAVQKRHLECLAEGPVHYSYGERLWRAGAPVDRAFLLVSGTASFVPKRRNAGSAGVPSFVRSSHTRPDGSTISDDQHGFAQSSIGDRMRRDALTAIKQLGKSAHEGGADDSSIDSEDIERHLKGIPPTEQLLRETSGGSSSMHSLTDTADHTASISSHHRREDTYTQCETALAELEGETEMKDRRSAMSRRRSSRARFANKVLGRLYSRRAFTAGLVFGRGHFLGDISKMVAGLVTSDAESQVVSDGDDGSFPKYGFGDKPDHDRSESTRDVVIYEQGAEEHLVHSSTLAAGKEGCVVLVFPKASLIPFLDEYPGLLLSLLGTQVVV